MKRSNCTEQIFGLDWSRLWKLVLMVSMVSIVSVLVSLGLNGLGLSFNCLSLDFICSLNFVADWKWSWIWSFMQENCLANWQNVLTLKFEEFLWTGWMYILNVIIWLVFFGDARPTLLMKSLANWGVSPKWDFCPLVSVLRFRVSTAGLLTILPLLICTTNCSVTQRRPNVQLRMSADVILYRYNRFQICDSLLGTPNKNLILRFFAKNHCFYHTKCS